MDNIFLWIYEGLNNYFVGFSGYLSTVITTVAFVFWGDDLLALVEHIYSRIRYGRKPRHEAGSALKGIHLDSFIVFLLSALIIIPTIQILANYLVRPLLQTTSLLVVLIVVFAGFYFYYVEYYRPKLLKR